MAVYTHLSDGFVRYMLSVYPEAGELMSLTGIPAGSINTSYRLGTSTGEFFLRVGENKQFADLIYEKNLLVFLEGEAGRLGGVATPRMVPNAARGYFFPVDASPTDVPPSEPKPARRAKYACLFEALKGRDLAVFEVEPGHVEQVGALLARAHLALRPFRGHRANPYGAPVLAAWLSNLKHAEVEQDLIARLDDALRWVLRHRRPLPRGVIHGDLFINNTKWHRGRLDAVFDWEMAGRDHLALDVAITLNAWCWRREPSGGGAFDDELASALLRGYQSVRPLAPSERRGFHVECCLGALRFTLSRIRDFGTQGEPAEVLSAFAPKDERAADGADDGAAKAPHRDFLDYREYEARLRALFDMGPKGLCDLTKLA